MSVTVDGVRVGVPSTPTRQQPTSGRFPPRPALASWPVTGRDRGDVLTLLASPPFVTATTGVQNKRTVGAELLLDWLEEQPGPNWQQRWLSAEAGISGEAWGQTRRAWLAGRGQTRRWHQDFVAVALRMAISADVVRPSLGWLLSGATGRGALVRVLASTRDPDGFNTLAAYCDADPDVSAAGRTRTLYLSAMIIAAKGGAVADITVGDVIELLDAQANAGVRSSGSIVFYRMLRESDVLDGQAPPTLGHLRTTGPRTPEEMIDRYAIVCRPVRDVLVDYLKERQPALDHNSLENIANSLGQRVGADLEAHHPGIDSLHLATDVAAAWKQRLRTRPAIVKNATGDSFFAWDGAVLAQASLPGDDISDSVLGRR